MQLALRDLKQTRWELDVNESDTVAAIKEKNAEIRGYDESVVQKFIYSGRILKDSETIGSYEIAESGFVVCMTSKKKVKKETAAPEAQPTAAAAESTASSTAAPAASTGASNSESGAAGNGSVPGQTDAKFEETVNNIMEMGYERPLVLTALRMAYSNPDRAVEFLLTGQAQELRNRSMHYFEEDGANTSQAGAAAQEASHGDAGGDEEGLGGDEPEDTTDMNLFDAAPAENHQLTDMPEDIRQLRELVRQNPSIMEPLIQQLAEQNPMLAEAITQNLDEFLGEGDDLPSEAYDDQNTTTLEITPEENEAISRLMELGFDRNLVIQAYFACDKNEEITANYLFEHGYED